MSKLPSTVRIETGAVKRRTAREGAATAARATKALPPPEPAALAFEGVSRGFTDNRRVEQGRMFGSPCLKVAGRVFAALVSNLLIVKLPRSQVDRWVAAGQATRFDPGHGRVMKEWLSVPVAANREWAKLAQDAFEFVASHSFPEEKKIAHTRRPRSPKARS